MGTTLDVFARESWSLTRATLISKTVCSKNWFEKKLTASQDTKKLVESMLAIFNYFFGTFTVNFCRSYPNEFLFAEMMLLVEKR